MRNEHLKHHVIISFTLALVSAYSPHGSHSGQATTLATALGKRLTRPHNYSTALAFFPSSRTEPTENCKVLLHLSLYPAQNELFGGLLSNDKSNKNSKSRTKINKDSTRQRFLRFNKRTDNINIKKSYDHQLNKANYWFNITPSNSYGSGSKGKRPHFAGSLRGQPTIDNYTIKRKKIPQLILHFAFPRNNGLTKSLLKSKSANYFRDRKLPNVANPSIFSLPFIERLLLLRSKRADEIPRSHSAYTNNQPFIIARGGDGNEKKSSGFTTPENDNYNVSVKTETNHFRRILDGVGVAKRRRQNLSVNGALMILTDMVLEHGKQKLMRNQNNLRYHLFAQG